MSYIGSLLLYYWLGSIVVHVCVATASLLIKRLMA
jgi:hypothetical protein